MEIQARESGSLLILDVHGDVDLSTSPSLRTEILQRVGPTCPSLLVNLTRVTYMDSSGLATLVEALQVTRRHGGRLGLFGLSERIQRIFQLAHLGTVFDIHDDETTAVTVLTGGPQA